MDVLHIFNSLNYIHNLNIGVDAAIIAVGFMEDTLSYKKGVLDPNKGKYNIKYYIQITRDLSDMGFHYLAFKDTAGLLTSCAATIIILALREELPGMPFHMKFPS